ncbi:MAG: hypothetical protein GYB67_09020, partial [Chloroflexi bacterium]|nr:hypothetical protein [Chloroflexota bacterium]
MPRFVLILICVLLIAAPAFAQTNTDPVEVVELEGAVLERDGTAIHYWLAGPETAPLVTFTHGALMDHRMFLPQVAALVPEYRVLVWDVR